MKIRLISDRTGNEYLTYIGTVPRVGDYITMQLSPCSVHDPVWFTDLKVQKVTHIIFDDDATGATEIAVVQIKDPRPKIKK